MRTFQYFNKVYIAAYNASGVLNAQKSCTLEGRNIVPGIHMTCDEMLEVILELPIRLSAL